MSNDYSIAALGGNYMYDPYFLAAMNSYNTNFKGSQATKATQQEQLNALQEMYQSAALSSATDKPATVQATSTLNGQIGGSNNGPSAGKILTYGALAAATIGGYIYTKGKGNGSFIDGLKNIWNGLKNEGAKITQGATNKLTIIRKADGTTQCVIPNKKVNLNGDKAEKFAKENGLFANLLSFKNGETVLNNGTFKIDGNLVTFKDGEVTEILNNKGKSILDMFKKAGQEGGVDQAFADKVNEVITNASKMEKGWAKTLDSFDVTRKVGDDIAVITYNKGKSPVINKLTTLQRFSLDDEAVRSYIFDHPELQECFTSKAFKNGKILQFGNLSKYEVPYDGKIFRYENNEIVGFVQGGRYYKNTSDTFKSYMLDHHEKLEKHIEQAFKDGKVPSNVYAVIQAAA